MHIHMEEEGGGGGGGGAEGQETRGGPRVPPPPPHTHTPPINVACLQIPLFLNFVAKTNLLFP